MGSFIKSVLFMHTAGRIRQVDVRIVLVATPSRNVRTS